jgi:nucleotide-binding universal stress UspA family protein
VLPQTILVATDFSETADRAVEQACEIAVALRATVHLVHCIGAGLPELPAALSEELWETLRDDASQALEKLEARHADVSWGHAIVLTDDPHEAILASAKKVGADLIVMGTHGRRGFSRIFIGSVAEYVIRRATCPVLTVRVQDA